MEIIKYDGTKKDWTLFKRKRGQQDWEWKDVGANLLNSEGLINMEEFYGDDGRVIFFDLDGFIEFETSGEFYTDLLKNGDYDEAKEHLSRVVERCEYIEKYMNDESLIIYEDASDSVEVVPKFAAGVTEDSTEYCVGVAK